MAFRYFREVLPSGLRAAIIETPHLHTAMLAVYVRAGSRHETPEDNGVSHFLEHMFFRGSEGYPDTVQMNALVEDVGGNLNGVTTRDHGYYYTPVHPQHVGVALDVIGDMIARPLLREMEVERQVILEEMLDEVDEEGNDIDLDNLSKMEVFRGHPMGLKIAGTQHSVKRLQKVQLERHLARHYVAGNMVVAVAGPVRHDEVRERIASAFAGVRGGESIREEAPPPPPIGPWLRFVEHDEAQTEFRLLFPTVPETDPNYPALQVLRRILDDGLSSRLPFNVVERRGLAYSLHAGLETFPDCGFFEVDAACAPEKAGLVVEAVCETLGEVCNGELTEEEVARAQRRHRMFLEFAHDAPGELVGWFGGTELYRRPEPFEERCRLIESQSVPDVVRVARTFLHREALGVVAVGQRKGLRALQRAVDAAHGLPNRSDSHPATA
ncbi:MAG TPA: pitrilysin family protein [Myxococcaceae bacterium]|nr:pitrilysin family protein [Myxococcaceae bacterium]